MARYPECEVQSKPLVLKGLVAQWPAVTKWAGNEGLQYLQQAAGSAGVQAIRAPGGLFYGNIEQVDPVPCRFGDVLEEAQGVLADGLTPEDDLQLYLAQQALHQTGLEPLLADIQQPPLLEGRPVQHTNLWMCSRPAHSSIHFDPYHNLLCVVTGSKTVTLMDPGCTPGLYARPLEGESSNHSSVNFRAPDSSAHPLYRYAQGQSLQVTLGPGDALFIPEGWWHQVDSAQVTLAINYWWPSQLTQQLQQVPHLHHHYMRMLASALTATGVQHLLDALRCPVLPDCTRQQQQQQQQQQVLQEQQDEGQPAERGDPQKQRKRRAAPEGELEAVPASKQIRAEGPLAADHQDWSHFQRLTVQEQQNLQQLVLAAQECMPAAMASRAEAADQPLHEGAAASVIPGKLPDDGQLPRGVGSQRQQQQLVLHAVLAHEHDLQASGAGLSAAWDGVTAILARCSTASLVNILYVLAVNRPQVVQQLFDRLSPASAHLLAQHMDATDMLFAEQATAAALPDGAGHQDHQLQGADTPCCSSAAHIRPAAAAPPHTSVMCTREGFFAAVYACLADADAAFQRLLAQKEQVARLVKAATVVLGL